MKLTKYYKAIIFFGLAILLTVGIFLIFSQKNEISISLGSDLSAEAELNTNINLPDGIILSAKEPNSPLPFFSSPETVKAIYVTSWSASTERYIDYIINLAKTTEINGVVIDLKDWSGYVAYDTALPAVAEYGAKSVRIRNIKSLIERLHQEGIYLIARISVFQDPLLALARPELAIRSQENPASLWLDRSGLAWIDPAAKEAWDYNIAIAQEAVALGFDEINFDYIRFPSDGNLKDMSFLVWDENSLQHIILKEFFAYLRQQMPEAVLSVDLFGLSTVNFDDLGIGQIIEDAFEYFDYVCPMVYPSHYAPGFLGYANPANYPYEVVKYSLDMASARLSVFNQARAKLRPWLQDFDLGAVYNASMVKSQITATYEATGDNFSGFMLWNPSNVYTLEALSRNEEK
jgi:hypothetical protein